MMRKGFLCILFVAGCTWSNSLYQARVLSGDAARADREGRPGDAQQTWSQAAVKAESAYARSPRGIRGAEAEWLRGRALARSGDCVKALNGLQVAYVMAPTATWRDPLLLEIGRCREAQGDLSASALFEQLVTSSDPVVRAEARPHAAHALVEAGRWSEALPLLSGLPSRENRLDRAKALAALHRSSEALAEVRPLVSGDTTMQWNPLLEFMAGVDTPATDTLLALLAALPPTRVNAERQAGFILAAARGSRRYDPAAADRRLRILLARQPGAAQAEARLLWQVRLFEQAASIADLKAITMENAGLDGMAGGFDVGAMRAIADRIVAEDSTSRPGAALGDLVYFTAAERARDSLRAPRLAVALLARVEREWPASPYVPKALLARIFLQPDSAEALRARFARYPTSQYAAFLRGAEGPAYVRLEDSLDAFAVVFWRRSASAGIPK